MKFAEEYKIVLSSALNYATAATNDADSINMKNFHWCVYLIDIGTMAVGDAVMTVNSGATAGAVTSALTFNYAYGSSSAIFGTYTALHDVLAATTSAATLTITQATYPNYLLVVEVDASQMDVANGEEWLTLRMTDAGGNPTGLASVFAILKPRYTSNRSATAVA